MPPTDAEDNPPKRKVTTVSSIILIFTAIISCLISLTFLLWGLFHEGPAFYNGQECTMTYSRFKFLPLRVVDSSSSSSPKSALRDDRYRLLKFTDGRDPRHQHFYPISGLFMEDYQTQQNTKKRQHIRNNNDSNNGRLLEFHDNWCLLSRDEIDRNVSHSQKWSEAPHPHRGHFVLYVPGHWGSFSQSRSLGAHGTRWTGPYQDATLDRMIFQSLKSGVGMHDGTQLLNNLENGTGNDVDHIMDLLSSPKKDGFVMDVFAADFGEEGAALHSSKILNQAEFISRAIETIVEGCHLDNSPKGGITIVAHSIGAWAVRASLDMSPHLVSKGWVQNVINLASPLQSIPYVVDSGVHNLVQSLNKRDNDVDNTKQDVVATVSISGGLRDEMIPPILSGGKSENNFLASSIIEVKETSSSSSASTQFGMDHRCIVWCYDLLTKIREVIFVLAVATDRGLNPNERMKIVRRTLHRTTHSKVSFEDEVNTLHKRAVDTKGYAGLVVVQLAAPYYLNCVLKLCILAALVHSLLLRPLFLKHRNQQIGQKQESRKEPMLTSCMEVSVSLLCIPMIITMTSWLRRLDIWFFGWRLRGCFMHECELLLGTIFVLSQLSALVYFIMTYGAGFVIVKISLRHGTFHGQHLSRRTFGTMLGYCSMRHIRCYTFTVLPLAVGMVFFAKKMNGSGKLFDSTALCSTLVVSLEMFVLGCLFNMILKPTATNLEERQMVFVILLLSLLKATYGKLIYAYSTLVQGANHVNSWHDDEMLVSCVESLLPAVFAIMAVETHDVMARNVLLELKRGTRIDTENIGIDIDLNKALFVTNSCMVIWYTWNVLVNYSGDDIVVLLYSLITVATTHWKCRPLSADAVNIYSAIIDDDLSLQCEIKDKAE